MDSQSSGARIGLESWLSNELPHNLASGVGDGENLLIEHEYELGEPQNGRLGTLVSGSKFENWYSWMNALDAVHVNIQRGLSDTKSHDQTMTSTALRTVARRELAHGSFIKHSAVRAHSCGIGGVRSITQPSCIDRCSRSDSDLTST